MKLNLDRICRNVMIKIHNAKLPTDQKFIDRALKVAYQKDKPGDEKETIKIGSDSLVRSIDREALRKAYNND